MMENFFRNNQVISPRESDGPLITTSDLVDLPEGEENYYVCRMDGYTILPTEKYEELLQAKESSDSNDEQEPPKDGPFNGWTLDNLQEVQRKRGFQGLKDIGKTLGVTSSGSKMLIDKILNAQDERRSQQNPSDPVEFQCANIQDLYRRPVNMEEGVGPEDEERPRFPPLVDETEGAMIVEALEKFGVRWGFTFEFVLKFQAFRCLKDGAHVDWIQINELCKMYTLPINPSVLVLSKRLYTAPNVRAWRPE